MIHSHWEADISVLNLIEASISSQWSAVKRGGCYGKSFGRLNMSQAAALSCVFLFFYLSGLLTRDSIISLCLTRIFFKIWYELIGTV